MNAIHIPVMANEVLQTLGPRADEIYLDGTFGLGGYAREILDTVECTVWALDCDPEAITRGQPLVEKYAGRLTLLLGRFGNMLELLRNAGIKHLDGIVLDLGVSSPQLDNPERGFSFRGDGPLDMRMTNSGPTAADIVNTLEENDLAKLIRGLGEERYARRVARAIVAARATGPISGTLQLAEIVRNAVPQSKDGLDPATRTFMALRLHVNDELGELERGLAAAEQLLRPNGRLVVVSFHSLEDRRIKHFLRDRGGQAPRASRHQPIAEAQPAPTFQIIHRRGVTPTAGEVAANPRARSARLRVAVRTSAPAWPLEDAA